MPRFSVKALLILFAAVALYLSSFTGYVGANDVRRTILLLVFCASTAVAFASSGKRRAFWCGFLVVVGMFFYSSAARFVPQFDWAYPLISSGEVSPQVDQLFGPPPDDPFGPPTPLPMQSRRRVALEFMVADSIQTCGMLLLAAVGGFVSKFIYARNRPSEAD